MNLHTTSQRKVKYIGHVLIIISQKDNLTDSLRFFTKMF